MAVDQVSRRTVLRGLAGSGLAVTVAPTVAGRARAEERRPPNVILVSIDDLGWQEFGCYGQTFNETPRIDALAADGVRFTAAYAAAPLCSPTRAAFVTGRYPVRTGITDFLRAEAAPSAAFLSPDVPTVPDVLGPLGYTTGLIGKWHLTETYSGPYAERPGNPYAHGFDEVVMSEEKYIADGDYFHPYDFMPSVEAREPGEHLTDRLADEAVDFVTRHADAPFFLHLSNYAVHTKLDAKPDLVAKYEAKPGADDPANQPVLAAMLQSVDEQVGRIVDALTELGLTEDTLLLVTSDNGGAFREATAPLRGGKGELYEGGIRVPLVAYWPGRIERPGRTDDTPVSSIDVLPTALGLAGGSPAGPGGFDGISIAALLTGSGGLRRDTLFWVYPHHIGKTHPHAAIREGDLKLVQHLRDGRVELYDLARDPGETDDLADRRRSDTRRLRRRLEDHLRDVAVLPPTPSPGRYPVPELRPGWGDLSGFDVLPVLDGPPGDVGVEDGRLTVSADQPTQLLLRSGVAPASDRVAAVLAGGTFPATAVRSLMYVGLARDADNYLLLRYRHDLRRVGWDLSVDGTLITAGREPLDTLDGSIDLSGPKARFGFVLRGAITTAYADQGHGAGWEFLFRFDTGGAFNLADPAFRAATRYTAGVHVDAGTVTLGAFSAARAT